MTKRVNKKTKLIMTLWFVALISSLLLVACNTSSKPVYIIVPTELETGESDSIITPFPTKPVYAPGTLVDYTVQTGDTLPALAARFNTTVEEILEVNTIIPQAATTLPPGMPMQIPIYYRPLWGTDFQIIPDSVFIYSPQVSGFNTSDYINTSVGWLKYYKADSQGRQLTAAQMILWIAENYSINPQVLLALIEYQKGAVTGYLRDYENEDTWLGFDDISYPGIYLQISYAANLLNDGFYRYRAGVLTTFEHLDGRIENTDPWQNAATVALQYYFSRILDGDAYQQAIGPDGYLKTFQSLFGDPWVNVQPHIPGSLIQPELSLPFEDGKTWALTGGPHTGWGNLAPWAAVDFAPPSSIGGCAPSPEYSTAVAAGVIARTGPGLVVLDLDGDGNERTGWVIFYLHIAAEGMISKGSIVEEGDPIGHPSCEGGRSTGTHIHIARRFNGEWIPAQGVIPLNLFGWVAENGDQPYTGSLVKGDWIVISNPNPDNRSFITAGQ